MARPLILSRTPYFHGETSPETPPTVPTPPEPAPQPTPTPETTPDQSLSLLTEIRDSLKELADTLKPGMHPQEPSSAVAGDQRVPETELPSPLETPASQDPIGEPAPPNQGPTVLDVQQPTAPEKPGATATPEPEATRQHRLPWQRKSKVQ